MIDVLEVFRIRAGARPLLLFAIAFGLLAVLCRSGILRLPDLRWTRIARRTIAIAAAIAVPAYVASALWYASDAHFFDNAEPTIVSVGWLFHAGRPLYHAVDAPERYALIYGPLAYIFHGVALSMVGASIGVSKALGALAALASLPLTYAAVRRHEPSGRAAIVTGLYALILLLFRHYSFWTRPEPFQLCAAAASLLFAARGRGAATAIAVGVASGVLWNLKFTGPLYSAPIFVLFHARTGWRNTLIAIAAGAAVATMPFVVFPNVSLTNYILWARLSAGTGLLLSTVRQNIQWAAFLLLPVLISHVASIGDGRRRDPLDRAVVSALVLGMIGVVVASAKPGAGPYHLMPFLPVVAYIVARNTSTIASGAAIDPTVPRAAIAFVAVASLVAIAQQAHLVTTMRARGALREIADIEAFANTHRGVTDMGYGSTEALSLARPVLTFRSSDYLLDQAAIREHQLAGIELPRSTTEAISSCRVGYWLIPKGEAPFSGVNGYAAVLLRPLYPEDFRKTFLSTHVRVAQTAYYDVWQCQPGSAK